MNIVNEDIVIRVLKSIHPDDPKTTLVDWSLQSNVVKAGNNYLSEVYKLLVEYEKNHEKRKKILFVKAPFNSPMYEACSKYDIFLKEVTMYTQVLPQLYTLDETHFTARLYLVDDKQSLFMKDLSQSGYKNANRTQQLDFEHCCYAFKCLAKLHALSVQLERTSGLPDVVRKDPFYYRGNQDEQTKQAFLGGLQKFYDNLDPAIRAKYAEQIERYKSITWDNLVDEISPQLSTFNVLNHGDYWTNNIMFKYDKYGSIKKAKMLDFQISRWANPALDLVYLTITSMRFEVYEKYFDLLLSIYLDTLNGILSKFNCPTHRMDVLKKDIEDRYAFAVLVLTCLLPIIVSDPDDPIDMTSIVKDDEFDPTSMEKTYKQKLYLQIATKWFLHFAEKDSLKKAQKKTTSSHENTTLQTLNAISNAAS